MHIFSSNLIAAEQIITGHSSGSTLEDACYQARLRAVLDMSSSQAAQLGLACRPRYGDMDGCDCHEVEAKSKNKWHCKVEQKMYPKSEITLPLVDCSEVKQ